MLVEKDSCIEFNAASGTNNVEKGSMTIDQKAATCQYFRSALDLTVRWSVHLHILLFASDLTFLYPVWFRSVSLLDGPYAHRTRDYIS